MAEPIWEDPFDDGFFDVPGQAAASMGPGIQEEDDDGWFLDTLAAVPRGLAGAAESVLELGNLVGFDYDLPDNFGLGHSTSLPGSMLEGTTQFLSGFIPIGGQLSRLGTAAKASSAAGKANRLMQLTAKVAGKEGKLAHYGKTMAQGALADFLVFAEDEARLSNALLEIPGLEENDILQFLAQDDEDGALESRLKNVLEGAGAGLVVDSFIKVLKGIGRRSKILKSNEAAATKRKLLEDNEAYIEDAAREGIADRAPSDFEIDREAGSILQETGVANFGPEARMIRQDGEAAIDLLAEAEALVPNPLRKRGADNLFRRLELEANKAGGDARSDLSGVRKFVDLMGDEYFDDIGLSIHRNLSAAGRYEFASRIMRLATRTVSNGNLERTAIHELWHHLSDNLPARDVDAVFKAYGKALDAEPAFKEIQGLQSRELTQEKYLDLVEKYGEKEVRRFLQRRSDVIGMYEVYYTDETYRLSNADEWFAETLTDVSQNRLDRLEGMSPTGTVRRIFQDLAVVMADLFVYAKEKLGFAGPEQRIFNDFLKGKRLKRQGVGGLYGSDLAEMADDALGGAGRSADEVAGGAARADEPTAPGVAPEPEIPTAPQTLEQEFPELVAADYRSLQREAKQRGIKATQKAEALREQLAEARRNEAQRGPETKADVLEREAVEKEAELVAKYGSVEDAPKGKRSQLKSLQTKARRRRAAERIAGVASPEAVGGLSPFQVRVRDLAEETVEHGSLTREESIQMVELLDEAAENGEDFLEKISGVINTATLSSKANRMMAILYSQQKTINNAVDHLGNPIKKGEFDEATAQEAGLRMWADMWGRRPEEVAQWMERTAMSIGEDSLNVQGFLKYLDVHLDNLEALHRAAKGNTQEMSRLGLTQDQALEAFGNAYRQSSALFKGFGAMRRETGRSLRRFHTKASRIMTPEMLDASIKDMGGRDLLLEQGDKLFEMRNMAGKNNMAAIRRLERFDKRARATFMLNEYFVNMVLSAFRTLSTNTIGNFATTVYGPIEALMGARLKQGIGTLRGENTDVMAEQAKRALDEIQQLFVQFTEAGKWSLKALKKGDYILDGGQSAVMDLPKHMKDAWGAENLGFIMGRELDPAKGVGLAVERFGNILRMPSRGLMFTDEFFKQWNYRASVASDLLLEGRKKVKSGEIENLDEFVDKELSALTRRGQALTERNLQAEAAKRYRPDDPQYQHTLGFEEMQIDREQWIKKQFGDPEVLNRGAIADRALRKARERTFTNDLDPDNGFLSSLGTTMQTFGTKHPLFRLFVPFIRTPMNIFIYAGRRTALPVVNRDLIAAGEYLFKVNLGNKKADQLRSKLAQELTSQDDSVRAEAAGRMMSAIGFSTAFFGAAAAGNLTGAGPKDKDQRSLMQQAGWQPYSIKVGDTYVSYSKLDPFATIAGIFADMFDAAKYADRSRQSELEIVMTAAAVSLAHNVQSKSYLQGLVQATGIISDPEVNIPKTGGRLVSALTVPALVASFRDATDPNMLEVRGMADQMIARIPLLGSAMLDPQRTVLGEPVDKKTFGGVEREFADVGGAFLPMVINRSTDDVVSAELAALAYPFSNPGEQKYGTLLTDHVNAKGQTAYDRWMELVGEVKLGYGTKRNVRQTLRRLIQSSAYQGLPRDGVDELDEDSPRVREINRVLRRYRAAALRQMLQEFPDVRAQARNKTVANQALRRGVGTDVVRNQLFPLE